MLASEGARVVLLARDAGALDRAANEIGTSTATVPCDLTDPDAVEGSIARVREALGAAPDIIVNSAGQLMLAPVSGTSVAEFDRLLLVNLTAPFAFLRAFVPELRERGSGHVVTIGSLADRVGLAGNAAYAASKFGLRGLHEVLLQEIRGTGVRATLVEPAATDTPLWDPIDPDARADLPPRASMLRPEEVAAAVIYAAAQPAGVQISSIALEATGRG